jgi:hypothetical protein
MNRLASTGDGNDLGAKLPTPSRSWKFRDATASHLPLEIPQELLIGLVSVATRIG